MIPNWSLRIKRGNSCSFRTNLVSFRTFRRSIFPKPVSWLGLFCLFLQQDRSRSLKNKNIITYFWYLTDSFDMGFDIQHYYSLHQNLTLEDLAKASSRHTLKGVVKVINKVSLSPKGAFTIFQTIYDTLISFWNFLTFNYLARYFWVFKCLIVIYLFFSRF